MAGSVFGVLKDPFPLLGGRLGGWPGFLTLRRKIQPNGASISPGGRQKPGVERRVRLGGGSPLHRVTLRPEGSAGKESAATAHHM